MTKKKLGLAVLTASAVFTLGMAFSSFAAWESVDGEWVYTDNSGNRVTGDWRSDNGESYYLDDDGYMVRNTLLEYNGNYYYLRSGGQMLKNSWRYLENPSWQGDDKVGEGSWYYFDNSGKALRTSGDSVKIADIGGKKYAFDSYGRMLTGWITTAGENISDEADWADATYYGDSEGDGSLVTNAWLYISVKDDDNEDNDEPTYHFYFASNGKKVVSTDKTIGNVKYTFDERGVSQDAWVHDANKDTWKYYGEEDEPKLYTGWFEAVPAEDLHEDDYSNGTTHWYYANSKGEIAMSEFKTIDGKAYAFNEYGELITGLRIITFEDSTLKKITGYSDEVDSADTLEVTLDENQKVFYLTSDKGAKTGTATISLDGTNYTFEFKSNGSPKGAGYTGTSDGYLYRNGMRLRADDGTKYQIKVYDDKNYLLNESGSIQKNKKNVKDSDGVYYCTDKSGIVTYSGDDKYSSN